MDKIRVILVEDDPELRTGFCESLAESKDLLIHSSFSDAEAFITAIDTSDSIDIVLMDIGLPGMNGIDCIRHSKQKLPKTHFIIWSSFEDDERIFDALKAGANGYLLKSSTVEQLKQAISEVYHGGSPMSSSIARKVIASFHKNASIENEYNLTKRESEILDLLAKGFRYKEIAIKLFVSLETVRSHVHHIYEKLQVSSRTDALNKIYYK